LVGSQNAARCLDIETRELFFRVVEVAGGNTMPPRDPDEDEEDEDEEDRADEPPVVREPDED